MNWRDILRRERRLLADLALMLVVCLVVGSYFLERLDDQQQRAQRRHLEAMASYLAESSREYLVTDNRVSLNVIARQAASLDTVTAVAIRSASRRELASAGERPRHKPLVTRAVLNDQESVLGSVEMWAAANPEPRRRLETGFVLVSLLLLALRVLFELVRRKLRSPEYPQGMGSSDGSAAEPLPPQPRAPTNRQDESARLCISIVNFDLMQQRFTASLLDEMLRDYEQMLSRVASLYSARVERRLGERGLVSFHGVDAAFNAVCAGQLFLLAGRRLSAERREAGRTPLEFKLLMSCQESGERLWRLCVAAGPGRVHIPESELTALELDTRLLYRTERAVQVSDGEEAVTLQPVEQLAQRYQRLVSSQAAKIGTTLVD
jgi:hypothetical protein